MVQGAKERVSNAKPTPCTSQEEISQAILLFKKSIHFLTHRSIGKTNGKKGSVISMVLELAS